jgi:tetratricopeptide (TPR) repeat protein
MMRNAAVSLAILLTCTALPAPAGAEQGVLVVQVADVSGKPIARVQLSTKGDGSVGSPTDVAGRTRIRLAAQTRPQAIVALTIVRAPRDLVFISPWDNQVRVPPFENESQNFASVVLAERGDRALLENGKALTALVSRLNLSSAAKDPSDPTPQRRSEVLNQTAALYGMQPSELDAAIRTWGGRTIDPYEKGMVALYSENLPDATATLAAALKLREEQLERQKRDATDAAFFLAQALYRQGKYADAAENYRKALAYRPGDPATTNNLGLTLLQLGDYAGAAPLLRQAIGAIEVAKGKNDPDVAFALNNIGALFVMTRDLDSAETAFRGGLTIREASLGPRDVRTANSLNNVASVLLLKGDDAGAEPLLARAQAIFEQAPPVGPPGPTPRPIDRAAVVDGAPGRPGLASVQLNQATLARHRGRLDRAKAIAAEVLRAQTQALGPRDPETANALQNLAQAELAGKEYAAAADHFTQALEILQAVFGNDHPALVETLAGLGDAAASQRDTARAGTAYRRAIAIRQRSFGTGDAVAAALSAKLAGLDR